VHAHLCDPVFDADRAAVIERAKTAGVTGIVAVGENLADAERNLSLFSGNDLVFIAAGLYPTVLDTGAASEMAAWIRRHRGDLIGIGEVGLDFWAVKDEGQRRIQREIFSGFIDLALELDLPLNVHSRSAGRHAVALLIQKGATRVHLHAFDGNFGSALPAIEAGFYFSVPPSVVRSEQKQKLVRQMPLSCLLIETDSPVLGPQPGERNEPANALLAVKRVAELKKIEQSEVLSAAYENTKRLYRI
jgi:TatD DNase family protein